MKQANAIARVMRATVGDGSFWLGLLPSLALLGGLYLAFMPEQPLTLNSMTTTHAAVVQGRHFSLDIRADVEMDCDGTVHRWIVRRIGTDAMGRPIWDNHPIQEPKNPITGTGAGLQWRLTLPLPASVTPGHWFYRSMTLDGCRWGTRIGAAVFGPPRRFSGLVPLTVVQPSADTPPAVVPAIGPVVVVPER